MPLTIEQLDWFVPPADDFGMPSYRACDICFLSATEDVFADKAIDDFRQFFRVSCGQYDHLDVCEHCLENYLRELREEVPS